MKLFYSTSITYPSSRANRLQVISMAKEFAKILGKDFYLGGHSIKPGKDDCGTVVEFSSVRSFVLAWQQLTFLKKEKVSHVYCREHKLLFFLALYNQIFFRLDLKYFYEAHDVPSRGFIWRYALVTCSGIVAITDGLKKELTKTFQNKNILVAPDAVDLSLFDISIGKIEARRKLSLPEEKRIVLYAGHLYEWKGAHTLGDATGFFTDDTLFVFVGGTEKDVSKYKEKYSKSNSILFLGQKSHQEIPLYLKSADVLVLPNSGKQEISRLYTSPLKLFEYMASGTPMVASDLSSLREILNTENAMLFDADNPEALADAIKKTLNDRAFAERISAKARMDVKNYSWELRAKSILGLIEG